MPTPSLLAEQKYALLFLAAVLLSGFATLLFGLRSVKKRDDFWNEYMNSLKSYLESNGGDFSSYAWMIENSMKMQRQMGVIGLFHHFRPAFSNDSYRNYPVLVNHLPKLHAVLTQRSNDFGNQAGQYRSQIIESMLRHRGEIKEERAAALNELKNPFAWFVRGISFVLAIPFFILKSFGILGATGMDAIASSRTFKLVAAFASIVGFASAIIGIVTGWDQFLAWFVKTGIWK